MVEKIICWDGECEKGKPICCFDCEDFEECLDACSDEKCGGAFDE